MGSQTEVYQGGGNTAGKVLKSPNEERWGGSNPCRQNSTHDKHLRMLTRAHVCRHTRSGAGEGLRHICHRDHCSGTYAARNPENTHTPMDSVLTSGVKVRSVGSQQSRSLLLPLATKRMLTGRDLLSRRTHKCNPLVGSMSDLTQKNFYKCMRVTFIRESRM